MALGRMCQNIVDDPQQSVVIGIEEQSGMRMLHDLFLLEDTQDSLF